MLAIVALDEFRAGFKSADARAAALEEFKIAAAYAYRLSPNNIRAL